MDFTIVTPSYRQLEWLGRCIASVADQSGVALEHIVQDAGSEGFAEFAKAMEKIWPNRPGYRRVMISEPDQGMYDAINKGLKRGGGRFCAYLNSDEQYLVGALARVKEGFEKNPAAEILYGGFLVVDEKGRRVTAQRPVRMCWQHVATSHLPNFSCATFFRRTLLDRERAWFSPAHRFCGDAVWTVERLKQRTPIHLLSEFLGVFTETGDNRGVSPEGRKEARTLRMATPRSVQISAPAWKLWHWLKKAFSGRYLPASIAYDLYMSPSANTRTRFPAALTSPFWPGRLIRS